MRPQTLLACLLGAAIAAAGWLQALRWKSAVPAARDDDSAARIATLENEIELLRRENESLRSLAQGGGEFKVAPELVAFVEQVLGLNFRSSPQVHQIAGEELQDRVAATIESRYGPQGLDSRQQAWRFMGLLGVDDIFGIQFAAAKSVGARSWFDEQGGEGWVTHRFDTQSIPDQAALIRTLARILIHQHNPPPPGWPGDEAANAREALHQGAAIAVENRFLARQALASGFTGAQEDTASRQLLESLSFFVRGLATFPATMGVPFANRLMDQEEILHGLHRPPSITAAYFPGHEELVANPPTLPVTPGDPLLETDESLGMLGLSLWLGPLGEDAAGVADAWRGDRYRIYATTDTELHLVWDIRLESAAAADALNKSALSAVSAMAGAEKAPAVGAILTTPDERHLVIYRPAPDIVRFVNAATKEAAASLAP